MSNVIVLTSGDYRNANHFKWYKLVSGTYSLTCKASDLSNWNNLPGLDQDGAYSLIVDITKSNGFWCQRVVYVSASNEENNTVSYRAGSTLDDAIVKGWKQNATLDNIPNPSPTPIITDVTFLGVYGDLEALEADYPDPIAHLQAIVLNPTEHYYHVVDGSWDIYDTVGNVHDKYLGVFDDPADLPTENVLNNSMALVAGEEYDIRIFFNGTWDFWEFGNVTDLTQRVEANETDIGFIQTPNIGYIPVKDIAGYSNSSLIEDETHILSTKPIVAPNIHSEPVTNEVLTIGADSDYPTVQAFLEAQQYRPKNNFTVTGQIKNTELIDTQVHIVGGNFSNVFVESEAEIVSVTVDSNPFTFEDCHPAPRIDLTIEATSLLPDQDLFTYKECRAPIGTIRNVISSGAEPRHVWNLNHTDFHMLTSDSEVSYCNNSVFNIVGGNTYLNHMNYDSDSKFLIANSGASINTYADNSAPVSISHTYFSPRSTPVVSIDGGSTLSNFRLEGGGKTLNGNVFLCYDSKMNNVKASYTSVTKGIEAFYSTVENLTFDIDTFTGQSIRAISSTVDCQMESVANSGGTIFADNATVRCNKATTVDYDDGSIISLGAVDVPPRNINTVTHQGICFVPTHRSRSNDVQVAAGFTYQPELSLNLEFVNIKLTLNVRDTPNALLNSYEVHLLNRPSGVEVVGVTDLGSPEHSFSDGATIDATISNGNVVLLVPTVGNGEMLDIDYDITYSR